MISLIYRIDLPLPKEGVGVDWVFSTSRCKLLYIERINSKVLP